MHEHISFVAEVIGWSFGGALLGLLHFVSLRWNVRCLLGGQPLASLGLQLLRFAFTAGALAFVTKWFGAAPLLASALGLMVARTGAVLILEPRR